MARDLSTVPASTEGGYTMRILNTLVAAGAVALTAGTASAASMAATKAKACDQYVQVDSALTNLKDIGPQSTIGDFHNAEQSLQSSYQEFSKTAIKVARPQTENLNRSIRHLVDTANNLPPDATVDQAKAMIRGDIARVQVSKTQLLKKLGCPASGEMPQQ